VWIFVGKRRAQVALMWHNDGDGLDRVWCGMHTEIRHEIARLVRRLEAL
jgi:hypothetical protein